ncbi:FlaD/FlaE family flagellar protein [Natrarchaeobaculum sulfurireducens]|nr:FlaD/FlaE family flagellar protein [Natrarchaeobaculum sulfurireducens]
MSEDELLPGASSSGDANTGGGVSDDDIFGDNDGDDFLDDGDDDFLADDGDLGGGEMAIGEMEDADSGVSSEIEARVEEMENDVGSLSSTVNTVQSENEKISESLEDIEENIRKLLEVYEMVTQGVNPFVEEDSLNDTFGGGAPGTGDFGGGSLFDSDDDGTDDEEMDEDIASAEAEEFLDESIIEDDEFADDDFADEEFDDGTDEEPEADASGGDDDLSFDELKSEFESGDAEWVEDEDGEDALGEDDALDEDDAFDESDTLDGVDEGDEEDEEDPFATADDDLETGDELTELADDDPTDSLDAEDELAVESVDIPWDDGGRPYLESVPSEYDTEFVVMDWLDYLVGEVGLDGAAETVRFYGSIHWLSESIEEYLQTILKGFHGGPEVDDPEPRSALGVDHKRSLWWISQIAAPSKNRPSYEEWLEQEGLSLESGVESDAEAEPDASAEPETDDAGTKLTYSESDVDAGGTITDAETGVGVATVEQIDDGEAKTAHGEADEDSDGESMQADDGGGHKIVIDESGTDSTTVDEPAGPHRAEIEANGERMIWVDSDVVLSESGVELRNTRDGHRVQNALEHARPPAGSEADDLEEWRESVVKPLIASDEETSLERWQVELIRSLLSPDDDADR